MGVGVGEVAVAEQSASAQGKFHNMRLLGEPGMTRRAGYGSEVDRLRLGLVGQTTEEVLH